MSTFTQNDSCEAQCDDDEMCFDACMEAAAFLRSLRESDD